MSQIIEISLLDAPELAPYARLTEAQLRNRRNAAQGMFIAESINVIAAALNAGCEALSLLMERRKIAGSARELLARCPEAPIYTGDAALLESLTGFRMSRGILCAMRRPAPQALSEVCKGARRIAVLENIVDPTNLGAIFRSAAALGMDAVLLTPACCDALHRRALRVSMGTVFQIPWARMEGDWPSEGMERLRALGFKTVALALNERALPIDAPQLKQEAMLALLLGTEGDGLTAATIEGSDYCARIPMRNGVDSLNVAAAAAVAFWELAKRS